MKRQKKIVEDLKLQNHIEQLWKKPKHNPLHFERAYLAHLPSDWNIFLQIWMCQAEDYKKIPSLKPTDHGQQIYNDPLLSVRW
jgi:hypothetical protein